jgi:hypothetical protein
MEAMVQVHGLHTEAEAAFKALRKSDLDLHNLSVVDKR